MTTLTKQSTTFEQYADSLGVDPSTDDPSRVAALRVYFEQEQTMERLWPTVIPPCPSWCIDEPGHDFDSWDLDQDEPGFTRFHTASRDSQVDVTALETFKVGGASVISDAGLYVEKQDDLNTPEAARAFAAQVLAAADVLERIMGATDAPVCDVIDCPIPAEEHRRG